MAGKYKTCQSMKEWIMMHEKNASISSHTVHQQMAEQERRWQETTAQIQNKLDMVIANTSGDEMISQVDFRSLNFDEVLGKDQFVVFFLSFQLHVK